MRGLQLCRVGSENLSIPYCDGDLEKVKAQDLQIPAGAFQVVGALGTKVLFGCSKNRKCSVAEEQSVRGQCEEMKREPSSWKNMEFMVRTFDFTLSDMGRRAGLG